MKKRSQLREWWVAFATGLPVVLMFLLIFWGPSCSVEARSDQQEIKALLIESKVLDRYYAFVASVEPVPNQRRRRSIFRDLAGDEPPPRKWSVASSNGVTSGYFTFFVQGWRQLSDQRRSSDEFKVYVEKKEGQPFTITKIETWCPERR